MVATGWITEEPDAAGAAMPVTNFILSQWAAPTGPATLGQAVNRVLSRAEWPDRYAGPEPQDPDEKAAALVMRGYSPGLLTELSRRLGDVQGELEAEREKIQKGARRAESIHRAHQAGRLDVFAAARALDEGDAGDEGRVRLLERRAESLRHQIAEAAEAISPPERQAPDPVEAAAQRAQRILAQVSEERRREDQAAAHARAQLARERTAFYAAWGRRPFASRGAGRSTEHSGE
jgi:hypothetical protein